MVKPLGVGALPGRPQACSVHLEPDRTSGLEYRVVVFVPPRQVAAHRQQHLDEAGVLPHSLDLRHRVVGRNGRHHHARAQPVGAREELLAHPVVDRRRHRRREVRVPVGLEPRQAVQHYVRGSDSAEKTCSESSE